MPGLRIIPTKVHGVLDYIVGLALIAAPWIFQFDDVDAAMWTAIAVGAIVLVTSLMTNYELSLARVVPMHVHLAADVILGIFLAVSPWLFGFSDEGTNAWLPHVAVGLLMIGSGVLSDPWPRDGGARAQERRETGRAA